MAPPSEPPRLDAETLKRAGLVLSGRSPDPHFGGIPHHRRAHPAHAARHQGPHRALQPADGHLRQAGRGQELHRAQRRRQHRPERAGRGAAGGCGRQAQVAQRDDEPDRCPRPLQPGHQPDAADRGHADPHRHRRACPTCRSARATSPRPNRASTGRSARPSNGCAAASPTISSSWTARPACPPATRARWPPWSTCWSWWWKPNGRSAPSWNASLELVRACPNITLVLNKVRLTTSHTFGAYYYYGSKP